MADVGFFVLVGGGAAALAASGWLRAKARDRAARAVGMHGRADLQHLPSELRDTALWSLCDGGRERAVIGGTASLGAHDVSVTAFELEALRDVRGEWAYLPLVPPFRLHSPLSVIACGLPRSLPHVLAKRAGRADAVADDATDMRSLAALVRESMAVGRALAADRPPTLPIEAVEVGPSWRMWAADPALARRIVDASVIDAAAQRLPGWELVIELLGGLVLLYPASGGVLTQAELRPAIELAELVCERALAATPRVDPRGVVP